MGINATNFNFVLSHDDDELACATWLFIITSVVCCTWLHISLPEWREDQSDQKKNV